MQDARQGVLEAERRDPAAVAEATVGAQTKRVGLAVARDGRHRRGRVGHEPGPAGSRRVRITHEHRAGRVLDFPRRQVVRERRIDVVDVRVQAVAEGSARAWIRRSSRCEQREPEQRGTRWRAVRASTEPRAPEGRDRRRDAGRSSRLEPRRSAGRCRWRTRQVAQRSSPGRRRGHRTRGIAPDR